MKTILKTFSFYALIPLIVSIPVFIINLCIGHPIASLNIVILPILTAILYFVFRKKMDILFAMKLNGIVFSVLLICFTVMMMIAKGNLESVVMCYFNCLILPFLPVMIMMGLMGMFLQLYISAILSYLAGFIVTAYYNKINIKKLIIPAFITIICILSSSYLYMNRPSVKYGGHGFDYMQGFSSTDFTDYTVYANNSKLITLDHEPSLKIENETEMPVLDGAEACYPLYAAFAKAVYKDIDQIELAALEDENYQNTNGKIVSFTNTIYGFDRLVMSENDSEKYGDQVDMFFGARPSAEQMEWAKECGVELQITPIGKEAFVFFVEKDNPVDNLTTDEVKAIYHGDITNWKDLGGKKQNIIAFQRPNNSGSQTMMTYFMGDVSLKEPQTYEKVDAMMGVIHEVAQYANEDGAIGYSFRYFLEGLNQEKGVKLLSINGIAPTLENIENGSYPLTTNVCLITRKNETNPNVSKMIDFILSEDGQTIIRKTGYAGLKN